MTTDFFKKDFGLTARESAALLIGAHSFGTFNYEVSMMMMMMMIMTSNTR